MVLFSYSCNTTNTYVSKIDIKKIDKVKPLKMVIQTGHNAFINSISFSPWQKYVGDIKFSYDSKIFEAVYHNRLKLFDTLTGNLIATTPGARKSNGVRTIAIIPDGNYIATADDFKISLWTITGKTFFAKNMDLFMKSEEEIKLKPFISK